MTKKSEKCNAEFKQLCNIYRNDNILNRSGFNPTKTKISRGVGGEVKRKIAFSLSEVLIALAIIGVVAAITMPMLIKNYQKKVFVAKLQKTYSELNNAYKLAQA